MTFSETFTKIRTHPHTVRTWQMRGQGRAEKNVCQINFRPTSKRICLNLVSFIVLEKEIYSFSHHVLNKRQASVRNLCCEVVKNYNFTISIFAPSAILNQQNVDRLQARAPLRPLTAMTDGKFGQIRRCRQDWHLLSTNGWHTTSASCLHLDQSVITKGAGCERVGSNSCPGEDEAP